LRQCLIAAEACVSILARAIASVHARAVSNPTKAPFAMAAAADAAPWAVTSNMSER
jgi:hypothetical protein